jgi:hypothetical protein
MTAGAPAPLRNHYIQIGQPAVVMKAIRAVVDAVRNPASWNGNDKLRQTTSTRGPPASSP